MAVNRANFWGHYGKGKGHPRQLPRGRRKFQALLFTGWEVRIGKNYDRGLNMLTEATGPSSQFFPIRTDHKPVNNLFIFSSIGQAHQGANQRRSSAGRFS